MARYPVPETLWALTKEVEGRIPALRASAQKWTRMYVRPKVQQLTYDSSTGSHSISQTYTIIQREEPHPKALFDLTEGLHTQPKYLEAKQAIITQYGSRPQEVEFNLDHYCRTVASLLLDGLGEDGLAGVLATFVAELGGHEANWFTRVWLTGIRLSDPEYNLGGGAILRRPVASDFEHDRPAEPVFSPFVTPPPPAHAGAILELRQHAKGQPEVLERVERMLTCLRLFGVGSVRGTRFEYEPESVLQFGFTTFASNSYPSPFSYLVAPGAESLMRDGVAKLDPVLSSLRTTPIQEVTSPILVALRRYEDALLSVLGGEGQITSAMTCLEALFLSGEERAELSHKLSLRVASVLGALGLQPLEVYRKLAFAYDMRSTFIHGSPLNPEQSRNLSSLLADSLEWCRLSLLVFLQLPKEHDKAWIISKSDNSLLDAKASDKLRKVLDEYCTVFRRPGRAGEGNDSEDKSVSSPTAMGKTPP